MLYPVAGDPAAPLLMSALAGAQPPAPSKRPGTASTQLFALLRAGKTDRVALSAPSALHTASPEDMSSVAEGMLSNAQGLA